ncbi:MAG: aryl-sulfate sulfotransferase [Verrucomicrobiota bacterium]
MRSFLLTALLVTPALATPPTFTTDPDIRQNENPAAPLAAIVTFETNEPVATSLTITEGERTWTINYPIDQSPAEGLPVAGFKYDRDQSVSVTIENADGETTTLDSPLGFHSAPKPTAPNSIPPTRVITSLPEKMEPGFTLASLRRNQVPRPAGGSRFGAGFGLLAAFDHDGEIVWSYESDARISDVEPLPNGNFLFLTTDFQAVEVDLLGNKVGHWYAGERPQGPADGIPIPVITMHHEIDQLANGNLLVMATEVREYDDWYTSETDPDAPRKREKVMGDVIVEFTRAGEIVWEWKALDHLDPYRIGYETFTQYWIRRGFPGARDWSHGNGFFHDERDDSLLISFRMQDAVVKIDRKSGEVQWILGNHGGWPPHLQQKLLTPEGEMPWFYHQHMPQLTKSGTLVLFDNRTWSARPFSPPLPPALTWTRAVEYEINEKYRTVKQLWQSEGPGIDHLMTFAMGEADALPDTGNVLVFYGGAGVVTDISLTWEDVLDPGSRVGSRGTRIREFTKDQPAQCVWDLDLFDESGESNVRWGIYGGARIPHFGPQ